MLVLVVLVLCVLNVLVWYLLFMYDYVYIFDVCMLCLFEIIC